MSKSLYVGIDVSLATLDVAVATSSSPQDVGRFGNEASGWQELASHLTQVAVNNDDATLHLLIEPTGGYEAGLLYFAQEQGWQITLVNPLQVRRWAGGQGIRTKTDRQDARMLAWFGATQQPAAQDPMDEGAQALDELLRRRHDVEQLLRAERNRQAQAQRRPRTPHAVTASLERTLRALEAERQTLEEAIQHLLKHHPYLQQQRRILRTAPAVGEKLSLELLVVCHRFWAYTQGQGTSKQIVAFLGLDPQDHQSGKSQKHAAISKQGNSRLRSLLYCGALGGIRGHNPLKAWYHHLLAAGKAKKLALVACSRKVLTWVWALFTSNQPFDKTRFPDFAHIPS